MSRAIIVLLWLLCVYSFLVPLLLRRVNPAGDGQRYKIKELETEELVSVSVPTLFFYTRMLFFRARLNILFFPTDFSLEMFLYYSWIIIEKGRIYNILFAVCSFFFYCIPYICISCTVHRTVISTDHLAITNAGFYVLLGSFAVGGRNNLIRLVEKKPSFRFSSFKIIIFFEISASGLFLKYS